jgi:hypothetical protein
MIGGGGGTRGAEGGVDWGGQRVCFWQFFTFFAVATFDSHNGPIAWILAII